MKKVYSNEYSQQLTTQTFAQYVDNSNTMHTKCDMVNKCLE